MFSDSDKSTDADKAEGARILQLTHFCYHLEISSMKKCGRSFIKLRSQDSKVLRK